MMERQATEEGAQKAVKELAPGGEAIANALEIYHEFCRFKSQEGTTEDEIGREAIDRMDEIARTLEAVADEVVGKAKVADFLKTGNRCFHLQRYFEERGQDAVQESELVAKAVLLDRGYLEFYLVRIADETGAGWMYWFASERIGPESHERISIYATREEALAKARDHYDRCLSTGKENEWYAEDVPGALEFADEDEA